MTDTNLPPGFCGAIADELERIAADLRKVEHVELPEPRLFQLDVQPGGSTDAEIIAAVDVLGVALLGKKGEHDTSVRHQPWYSAKGSRGPVAVSVYRGLSKRPDERDAELARLRAEVEQLRADRGLDYSRPADGDDPQQIGQRREPHFEDGSRTVHIDFADGSSMCGLAATAPHRGSFSWAEVTCKDCQEQGES